MNINGLQKLTLLDFPEHTACTVFLAGCDMKCPFCHNSGLIDGSAEIIMDDSKLLEFLSKRKGLLDGVAFTGGEPTLRKELPDLLKKIKELGYAVKLDTNGAHPAALKSMLNDCLIDYVAMDIKNSPLKYDLTAGVHVNIDAVTESVSIIMDLAKDYEFRTTVVDQLHDRSSFEAIGPMIKGAKRYFLQAFTDRDSVLYSGFSAPSKEKLEEYAQIVAPFVQSCAIRGVD